MITTPVAVTGENGEVIQHAVIQYVATSEQENIDPQHAQVQCKNLYNNHTEMYCLHSKSFKLTTVEHIFMHRCSDLCV